MKFPYLETKKRKVTAREAPMPLNGFYAIAIDEAKRLEEMTWTTAPIVYDATGYSATFVGAGAIAPARALTQLESAIGLFYLMEGGPVYRKVAMSYYVGPDDEDVPSELTLWMPELNASASFRPTSVEDMGSPHVYTYVFSGFADVTLSKPSATPAPVFAPGYISSPHTHTRAPGTALPYPPPPGGFYGPPIPATWGVTTYGYYETNTTMTDSITTAFP
jgi:hypothetical protein